MDTNKTNTTSPNYLRGRYSGLEELHHYGKISAKKMAKRILQDVGEPAEEKNYWQGYLDAEKTGRKS